MVKKYNFSETEYNSLRSELITRIGLVNTQSSTALTTIISTWAAGITLFVFLYGQSHNLSDFAQIIIRFIDSFIFLIPIAYFIPLSIKSGENITQIASLSAYIRVFFEYLREVSDDDSLPRYNWEISNTLVSNVNAFRKNKSKLILMINEEFTILSFSSVILYFLSAGLNILTIYNYLTDENSIANLQNSIFLYIIIIVYAIFAVLSVIMVKNIHKSSCIKLNLIDKSPIFVEAYIYRAAELGLIEESQISEIKEKLKPDNRLHRSDGSEISI